MSRAKSHILRVRDKMITLSRIFGKLVLKLSGGLDLG